MKYMLLMHYAVEGVPPMTEWNERDITAHIDFQVRLNQALLDSGELVDAQGLAESARIVTAGGTGTPVVSDGPFPESKEFLAGYRIVDVDSEERALQIAAEVSAAPGPGGVPIRQPIEVRPVLGASAVEL